MRYSSVPFSSSPYSTSSLDESLPATVEDLIADQEFPRTYLFVATPRTNELDVLGNPNLVEVRASIGLSAPILDGKHWPAILKSAIKYRVQLFNGSIDSPQGKTSIGNIELAIGDGTHDDLTQYLWNGASFQIYLGAEHFEFSTYRLVVSGTIKSYRYTRDTLTLIAQGKENLLDNPVQENSFSGSGDLGGNDGLRGVKKPIAYGNIFNASPLLVDPDRYIYYLQNGEIDYSSTEALSKIKVFDGGVELTLQGLTGTILGTAATPGYYYIQPIGTDSYIRLGAPPAKGVITIDYTGQVERSGSFLPSIVDPVLVLKDILINRTTLTEDDLDLASFTNVINSYAATPLQCGVYLQEESTVDAINYIMRSLVGAWTFTASGKLLIALFTRGVSVGTITEDNIVEGSFVREETTSPPYGWNFGFGRNLTTQTENDFAGAASSARRGSTATEYRYGGTSLLAIRRLYPDAKSIVIDSCLTSYEDTSVIRLRILDDFNNYTKPDPAVYHKPDIISFAAKKQQFKYEVGQTITINYDRFDYDDFGDKDMLIMAIEEDTTTHVTRFTCWG